MKGFVLLFVLTVGVQACGNSNSANAELKDPSTVHPPSEAIQESTKLVRESVIKPDTVPNNRSQVGATDSK